MGVLVQKFGDTRKAVWRTNFSLLNSTVELKVKGGDGLIDTEGHVEITDPYAGIVAWDHDGELPIGDYSVELWITRDEETFKAPSDGYETLRITPDLS